MNRYLPLILVLALGTPLLAQTGSPAAPKPTAPAAKTSSATATKATAAEPQVPSQPVNPILLSNQMMVTVSERIKAGALPEARKIAEDMIYGHEKITDSAKGLVRTFASMMGKKLFERQMRRDGHQEPVIWLQQPIADGFYFLAIIDFQDKKPKEALENIQRAIQWDPTRTAFFIERGFLMINQEQPIPLAEIAATYLKALELADDPVDFAAALRGLGYVFIEQNDWEGALACYLVSLHFDPQSEAAKKEIDFIKFNQPVVFKNLDSAGAIQALNRRKVPVKIDPVHVEILMEIANELPASQTQELKAVLKRALLLDPKNETIKKRLAALK